MIRIELLRIVLFKQIKTSYKKSNGSNSNPETQKFIPFAENVSSLANLGTGRLKSETDPPNISVNISTSIGFMEEKSSFFPSDSGSLAMNGSSEHVDEERHSGHFGSE